MTPPAAQVPRFFVRQHITLMVNRYEILAVNPDGTPGQLLAFAQQKRVALREEVTFYADRQQTRRLFSFKARKVVDLGSGYDVLDDAGRPVGFFRKDFRASLTRSTWHVSAHGLEATGRERSAAVALLRRVWDLVPYLGEVWVPFVFHFDFVDAVTGRPVMTSERQLSVRDRYTVTVPDPRLDLPLAASMAVALDALQGR